MLKINSKIHIEDADIKLIFIRSSGPGGQNVNKVATGVHLRFNILQSASLSELVRERLMSVLKNKLSTSGDLIIKATRYRTQEQNKRDALSRLQLILKQAVILPKHRKPTKPSKAAKQSRLDKKKRLAKIKTLRRLIPSSQE